jgi:uncharacterized protein YjbI with pentapeptide repeats
MLSHFRLIALAGVAITAAAASAAAALWPSPPEMARLAPGYGGVCEACDLSGRILVDARLSGGQFRRAAFRDAVMNRVLATDGLFDDADFSGAILDDGEFARARFPGANFTGASLAATRFPGADLSGAVGLTQAQLDQACGDAATKLPQGLHIAPCAT